MKKFVLGALALSASSVPSLAGTETDEWLALDRDIESLATRLAPAQGGGASVSGFVKTSYASSGDVTVGGNDLGGFSLDNARMNLRGVVGDYSIFVQAEGSTDPGFGHTFGTTGVGGGLGLLDSYVSWNCTDQIKGQMGQFRPPVLASSLRDEDVLLFIDRTTQGDIWSFRDQGLMASGAFDQLGWWVAIQNGADGAGDELAISGRVSFNALGTGPGANEGSIGASGDSNLTVAIAYYDDGAVTDGTAIAGDVYYTMGAFSASAEIVDYDDGFGFALPAGVVVGETPWNIVLGYMFAPDQWEAAVRFEDMADTNDTTAVTAGLNYYQAGHAAKWQLNYSTISSDANANEIDVIQAGVVVSI
jgi:hypothetical protein